eukprot:scaffold194502_cov39-Tisochrysis_lutea.AAC.5
MSLRPGSTLFARPEGLDASFRELIAEIPKGDKPWPSSGDNPSPPVSLILVHPVLKEYIRCWPYGHVAFKSWQGPAQSNILTNRIDLDVLIGPAYVLEIPTGVMNITGTLQHPQSSRLTARGKDAVLQELHIPKNCERLLLKTDNSRKVHVQHRPSSTAPSQLALYLMLTRAAPTPLPCFSSLDFQYTSDQLLHSYSAHSQPAPSEAVHPRLLCAHLRRFPLSACSQSHQDSNLSGRSRLGLGLRQAAHGR